MLSNERFYYQIYGKTGDVEMRLFVLPAVQQKFSELPYKDKKNVLSQN